MTRDDWLAEGDELIVVGRRLKAYQGLMIFNPASYYFMWRSKRWMRAKQDSWTRTS